MWLWNLYIVEKTKDAEMEFMRRTKGYSLLDHTRNDILEEIQVDPVENKLAQYKQKVTAR